MFSRSVIAIGGIKVSLKSFAKRIVGIHKTPTRFVRLKMYINNSVCNSIIKMLEFWIMRLFDTMPAKTPRGGAGLCLFQIYA